MSLKFEVESPKTQSIDAVKTLLSFKKVASNPLPQEVSLDGGRLVLVLSKKKDVYYTVTSRACSCPSATYHPGQKCKHIKQFFPESSMEGDIRASLPGWSGGAHGPVEAV